MIEGEKKVDHVEPFRKSDLQKISLTNQIWALSELTILYPDISKELAFKMQPIKDDSTNPKASSKGTLTTYTTRVMQKIILRLQKITFSKEAPKPDGKGAKKVKTCKKSSVKVQKRGKGINIIQKTSALVSSLKKYTLAK